MTQADSLMVQELGSDVELQSNQDIIDHIFADEQLVSLPMFVSGSLQAAIVERAQREQKTVDVVHAFTGVSAAGVSENLGTYGEWQQYAEHPLIQNGTYSHPAMATSAYNAGNSARQANMLGITPVIPEGLPRTAFDWRSNQLWTKHRLLWMATSHLRIALLRRKGH